MTRGTLATARELGYSKVDLVLLVGGSTKMPQVGARLKQEFGREPQVHDPDQSVAKGAAVYGQKLSTGQETSIESARKLGTSPLADSPRPNFFVILELDPAMPWNPAAFQVALSDKRNLWARQAQGVKGTEVYNAARRSLALISDIERIMLRDPEGREKERKEALQHAAAELHGKRDQFAEQLDLMLEKGYLWDVEYETLCRERAVLDADAGLRRKLEYADKRPLKQPKKDLGRLDAATERNLRSNLATLRQPSLYHVLQQVEAGVTEATSRAGLLAAADKLYQKARHTADKSRPEVGAMQQLSGIARRVFGTDDMKKRHDTSTRLFPLDAIIARYETVLSATRAIDPSQLDRFLREAAQKGIDIDVARRVHRSLPGEKLVARGIICFG